ncbi:MAG TPA: preprotein translocase subunit YajC [Terriglobales bacterium]|nr:preprotein translocase subunit YajC [Terriglobales bacterium]
MSTGLLLAAQTPSGGGGLPLMGMMALMFAVIYFLLIMPQQRRQKKWQQMLGELKTGDKVVTSGGLRGTIIALKEDYLHLRVPPDNLRVEVSRASIVSVTTQDEPAKQ